MSTFSTITRTDAWLLQRHVNGTYYVARYDAERRQMRRRSLGTADIARALPMFDRLATSGWTGDPRHLLDAPTIATVRDVLDWHRAHVAKLASQEAEEIAIEAFLGSPIADRRLSSLTILDFEKLRDDWTAAGLAIATVSRRMSTLRSALRRAVLAKRVTQDAAPHVPEFRTLNHVRSSPPKGAVCTTQALARLWDAAREPHLRLYLVMLFATAARMSAILELTGNQIRDGRIRLNPEGRLQTAKYRPVLPVIEALKPWLEHLPEGRLIRWHGEPVLSTKRAVKNLANRASLGPRINSYSVRHSVGRYLKSKLVPGEMISVWLGHIKPPANPEITQIYSPWEPDYLEAARSGVDAFFREIAGHARRDLLAPDEIMLDYMARLCARDRDAGR